MKIDFTPTHAPRTQLAEALKRWDDFSSEHKKRLEDEVIQAMQEAAPGHVVEGHTIVSDAEDHHGARKYRVCSAGSQISPPPLTPRLGGGRSRARIAPARRAARRGSQPVWQPGGQLAL